MAKAIALSDIAITHISLVKAGANGKQVIYKSANSEGEYEHTIAIKKNDEEKGVIYGIVYAPDEIDSQGDFATAGEIEKAAYAFMKARNTTNVDVDHSFEPEAAFVAESWIVKGGDSIFPNEPEGSWAVAIKLEDESLKALAKSGELAGISMAGKAQKTEVSKGEEGGAFKRFFSALADASTGMWVDFGTYIEKSQNGGDENMDTFQKELKEKIDKAMKEAAKAGDVMEKAAADQKEANAALQKEVKELADTVADQEKVQKELQKTNEALQKTNEEQSEAAEQLKKDAEEAAKVAKEANDTLVASVDEMKTAYAEVVEVVKGSKQVEDIKKIEKVVTKNAKKVM